MTICTVEALEGEVDYYDSNLWYSGGCSGVTAEAIDGCQVETSTPHWALAKTAQRVRYCFDRPIKRNETYRFVYRVTIDQRASEPEPFLYKSICHPTDELVQRVHFAPDVEPDEVWAFVSRGPQRIADDLLSPTRLVPDGGGVTSSVSRPAVGLSFGLRWRWGQFGVDGSA